MRQQSLQKAISQNVVFPIQVVNCLARSKSTAESGIPYLDFEMDSQLYNTLAYEITGDGLSYTDEEIPDIMTCAGEHQLAVI